MTKPEFIDQYVVTFFATWAANRYDHACSCGQHETLEKPPVEDAIYLAEAVWEHYTGQIRHSIKES